MSEDSSQPDFLPPEAAGSQPPPRWSTELPRPAQGTAAPHGWEPPAGARPDAWSSRPALQRAASRAGPAPRAAPGSGAGIAGGAWRPAASPAAAGGPGNGRAIAALVLGLVGLLALVFFAGALIFINLPCSILAWVLGVQGMRAVDRGRTAQHRSVASTGRVLGIIGVVLGVLAFAAWLVVYSVGGGADGGSSAMLLPGLS